MTKRHKAIRNAKHYRGVTNFNVPIVQNNNKKLLLVNSVVVRNWVKESHHVKKEQS